MKTIPYRITIELATNPDGSGVGLQFAGETPDLRQGEGRPSDYECTKIAAAILAHQAQQAATAASDEQTFAANKAFINMPTSGRPN